ncbi:MAG TPA: AmmeMemoRadiSam system protein A, partial [Candidatus Limnocylindrales bacterium]|nr:AmmeMemoRadiSam system protein A [Candidatus Limnocylindrales bacterium]
SGDLSHRLIPNAPGGYSPRGAEFDRLLVDYLLKGDVEKILQFDQGLVGEAGECGLRSFVIALGMFADEEFSTDVISYEGPFGVGYLVASLHPVGGGKAILDQSSRDRIPEKQTALNPARLARAVLSCYLEEGCVPKTPHQLSPEYERRAGVFVSLKKGGYLRGCIGTVVPVKDNLAEEIAANTVSAATKDPRFPPVTLEELADISVSVDILGSMERVKKETELDAKKYGVLVRSGLRSGLLLPDLEGVNTVAEQLDIARRKAGIASDERVELYRFGITRYSEC